MAETIVSAGNRVTQWKKDFILEYVREAQFARYSGTSENAIIQVYKDLMAKDGKIISIPLIGKLTNSGVSGDNTLEGNEENLSNYSHDLGVEQVRNAVRVGKMERKSGAIDILKGARSALKMWIMDDNRDDILQAAGSPNVDGVTAYASCSEAQKDAWVVANNISTLDSRIMFGSALSNSTGDHSADIAKVDVTDDLMEYDVVQTAKRLARRRRAAGGTRNIRPVRISGGRENFVMFCEMFAFRDLKIDMENYHQYAGTRGKDNPLFTDPDILADGTVCTEVPEIDTITGVGAAGIDVAPNYFCGGQAIGQGIAQMPQFVIKKNFDYSNKVGVSIGDVRGTEKLSHDDVQNGMVTVYTSGVADV